MISVAVPVVLPDAAKAACAKPVALPDRDLSDREAGSYWSRDRAALRTCEQRRAAAVAAAEEQNGQFENE